MNGHSKKSDPFKSSLWVVGLYTLGNVRLLKSFGQILGLISLYAIKVYFVCYRGTSVPKEIRIEHVLQAAYLGFFVSPEFRLIL